MHDTWACMTAIVQSDVVSALPGDNVVLDCGNQIFIRPGPASEAKEGVLAAEAATEALLEQLTQHRVPAPGLVRLHQVIRKARSRNERCKLSMHCG